MDHAKDLMNFTASANRPDEGFFLCSKNTSIRITTNPKPKWCPAFVWNALVRLVVKDCGVSVMITGHERRTE